MKEKEIWLKEQLYNDKASKEILSFIANIRFAQNSNNTENLFTKGYCYHFAVILKTLFSRGTICLSINDNHIVWLDGESKKDIAYDINGVYKNKTELLPISEIPEIIKDFKHIDGIYSELSDNEECTILLKLKEQGKILV